MSRSSSSRTPLLAVVALAIGLAVAYLSDCAGFGLGSGSGAASPDSDAESESEPAPETPPPETPPPETPDKAGRASERVVVVEGAQCRVGTEPLGSCDALCKTLVGAPGPVTLDGVAGSHQVVDALRQCLEDGKIDVRMKGP